MEVFRDASTQYRHRNVGVIRQAEGCNKSKNRRGALSKLRQESESAESFRTLVRDEDVFPIHDEWGEA